MVHGALVVGIPVDDVIANFWYFHALMIFRIFKRKWSAAFFVLKFIYSHFNKVVHTCPHIPSPSLIKNYFAYFLLSNITYHIMVAKIFQLDSDPLINNIMAAAATVCYVYLIIRIMASLVDGRLLPPYFSRKVNKKENTILGLSTCFRLTDV